MLEVVSRLVQPYPLLVIEAAAFQAVQACHGDANLFNSGLYPPIVTMSTSTPSQPLLCLAEPT